MNNDLKKHIFKFITCMAIDGMGLAIFQPPFVFGNETEIRMLWWKIGIIRLERIRNVEIRKRAGVANKIRECRLRWMGHLVRRDEKTLIR